MNNVDKNILRRGFRPKLPIKFLMIGESPPLGENFFYLCRGALYEHTLSVFTRVFHSESVPNGNAFLDWFQSKGCYVEDLCETSTNGMKWGSPERTAHWIQGIPRLRGEIENLKPKAVFVFVRGIRKHVDRAISSCNDSALKASLNSMVSDGPMPNSKGDPVGSAFEESLEMCLSDLQKLNVL